MLKQHMVPHQQHLIIQLLQMLNAGGRLLAVVGEEPMMQATRYTRNSHGDLHSQVLWDVVLMRLHGFAQTPAFQF